MKNSIKVNSRVKSLKFPDSQTGWTFWSLMFSISVIVFFAYIGMQLVPAYSANSNIKNAMEVSIDGVDLYKVNRATIMKGMTAQLYLDGTHQLLDYKTDLKLSRTKQLFTIETHYQRVIPLFFNISLLIDFDNVVEKELASR